MNFTMFLYCLIAYIVGSIPVGKIVGSRYGVDIQDTGTGNIGASNTFLVLGKKAGALVLLGDLGKSYLMMEWTLYSSLSMNNALVVGFFLLLGNMKSIFLKFTGGKGIATGLGIFLATEPLAAFVLVIIWGMAALFMKYIAYLSILGTLLIPFTFYKSNHEFSTLFCVSALTIMILIRHKSNVRMKQTEEKTAI